MKAGCGRVGRGSCGCGLALLGRRLDSPPAGRLYACAYAPRVGEAVHPGGILTHGDMEDVGISGIDEDRRRSSPMDLRPGLTSVSTGEQARATHLAYGAGVDDVGIVGIGRQSLN